MSESVPQRVLRITMLVKLHPDDIFMKPGYHYNKWSLEEHKRFVQGTVYDAYNYDAAIEVTNIEDVPK